jgi:hypothetical protein
MENGALGSGYQVQDLPFCFKQGEATIIKLLNERS